MFKDLSAPVFHILVALAGEDRHGYAIMQDVMERTGGTLKLSPGTLYGSIKRLLIDGWIEELEGDDRRRYYRLTKLGHAAAQAEAARLNTLLRQARASGLLTRKS